MELKRWESRRESFDDDTQVRHKILIIIIIMMIKQSPSHLFNYEMIMFNVCLFQQMLLTSGESPLSESLACKEPVTNGSSQHDIGRERYVLFTVFQNLWELP